MAACSAMPAVLWFAPRRLPPAIPPCASSPRIGSSDLPVPPGHPLPNASSFPPVRLSPGPCPTARRVPDARGIVARCRGVSHRGGRIDAMTPRLAQAREVVPGNAIQVQPGAGARGSGPGSGRTNSARQVLSVRPHRVEPPRRIGDVFPPSSRRRVAPAPGPVDPHPARSGRSPLPASRSSAGRDHPLASPAVVHCQVQGTSFQERILRRDTWRRSSR